MRVKISIVALAQEPMVRLAAATAGSRNFIAVVVVVLIVVVVVVVVVMVVIAAASNISTVAAIIAGTRGTVNLGLCKLGAAGPISELLRLARCSLRVDLSSLGGSDRHRLRMALGVHLIFFHSGLRERRSNTARRRRELRW